MIHRLQAFKEDLRKIEEEYAHVFKQPGSSIDSSLFIYYPNDRQVIVQLKPSSELPSNIKLKVLELIKAYDLAWSSTLRIEKAAGFEAEVINFSEKNKTSSLSINYRILVH